WAQRVEESWGRRLVMLVCGSIIGLHALWLDGWVPHGSTVSPESEQSAALFPVLALPTEQDMAEATAYLAYFALVFFALRWWKMTDRKRPQRFSFAPILAAAFWAVVLLLLWPQPRPPQQGAVALVVASAIVQLVSPWEEPTPPATRRLRLRYA